MAIYEITDFSAPELDVYARLTEGQLKSRADLNKGLFIAESPNVSLRALDAGYEPVSLLMERRHIEGQAREVVSRCGDVPLYTAPLPILTQLTGFPLTRGVLCAMRRRPEPGLLTVCAGARRIAVLENMMKTLILSEHPEGKIETGEVAIPLQSRDLILPCGIYGRWERL